MAALHYASEIFCVMRLICRLSGLRAFLLLSEVENQFRFVVGGQGSIYPMDGDTAPFHAAEPCHLAFGKLVYGYFEPFYHLVVRQFSDKIFGHKLVFETIVYERFGRDAAL